MISDSLLMRAREQLDEHVIPCIRQFIGLSIHRSFYQSVCSSARSLIRPSFSPSFIRPSLSLSFIRLSLSPFLHQSYSPFLHRYLSTFVHPSNHLVHLLTHPAFYGSPSPSIIFAQFSRSNSRLKPAVSSSLRLPHVSCQRGEKIYIGKLRHRKLVILLYWNYESYTNHKQVHFIEGDVLYINKISYTLYIEHKYTHILYISKYSR